MGDSIVHYYLGRCLPERSSTKKSRITENICENGGNMILRKTISNMGASYQRGNRNGTGEQFKGGTNNAEQ